MSLRVVGAGLGRTGTASLKLALEQLLGGRCHHMFEVIENPDEIPVWTAAAEGAMPDWEDFLDDYVALVDWPGCSFWPELVEAFPDALVLLSVRDLDAWYDSAAATIFHGAIADPASVPEADDPFGQMWRAIIGDRFVEDLADRSRVVAAARAHNEAVISAIPSDRLLVWSPGDGWEPICAALDMPVPIDPFPRSNSKQEFIDRREQED